MPKNPKAKLKSECDVLWYKALLQENCEVCGGYANQVHHFFPKGQYGNLRHHLKNGISICQGCHFKHHTKGDPVIHQTIIQKRGQDWYDELLEASKERSEPSTMGSLRETKEQLLTLTK
jgi:rRNA maturation protein Nop10